MVRTRNAARPTTPVVRRLDGVSVAAAWGAPDLLAPFVDRPAPTVEREAEVWYGAHARYPSPVHDQDGVRSAVELDVGERPAFLVKLLAASEPLSIQVHPDEAAARRGFAAEEAAGVPLDAMERRYVDRSGKPELIRAIGPMRALCGLRPAHRSRALISRLVPEGADRLLETLARGDAGLGDAVALVLRADAVTTASMLAAVVDGARDVVLQAEGPDADGPPRDEELGRLAQLVLDLAERHPGDAGTLLALLLEDVDLAPGDALAVEPGTPHAYLSGLGLEVMACSDNVLRAGLTVKHVDTEEFLAVLDTSAVGVPWVGTLPRGGDGTGWRRHILPTATFLVDEVDLAGELPLERHGSEPAIVLCVTGRVTVRGADGSAAELGRGGAVLIRPGAEQVMLEGRGCVIQAARVSPASAGPTSG